MDDLGRPRWTPEEWAWHSGNTKSPVQVGEEVGDKLERFDPDMLKLSALPPPCIVLSEGYRDLHELFAGWVNVKWVSGAEVANLGSGGVTPPSAVGGSGDVPGAEQAGGTAAAATQATGGAPAPPTPAPPTPAPPAPRVLVTSVLTNAMVDYIASGGVVLLLASKWPGAFATVPHMYWRDQPLVPPVGLWAEMRDSGRVPDILNTILQLQHYDLTRNYSQVVPVKDLEIEDEVDPLLRLFDTHDMPDVWTFDQLCATRCGSGMLMISSLDHSTPAGQWLLSELVRYCSEWNGVGATHGSPETALNDVGSGAGPGAEQAGGTAAAATQDTGGTPAPPEGARQVSPLQFPATSMTPERLKQFAVARANGVMALDDGWSFILDPEQQGEQLGYQNPGFDASALGHRARRRGLGEPGLRLRRHGLVPPRDRRAGGLGGLQAAPRRRRHRRRLHGVGQRPGGGDARQLHQPRRDGVAQADGDRPDGLHHPRPAKHAGAAGRGHHRPGRDLEAGVYHGGVMLAQDRFIGSILGLALGDAFGAPYEGGILERALWGVIGKTGGKRRWTDDTQMTLDVAEILIAQGQIDQRDLARRFAQSYHWSRGYGPSTARVLLRIRRSQPGNARTSVYSAGSYGNGGAMRAPVVGLIVLSKAMSWPARRACRRI